MHILVVEPDAVLAATYAAALAQGGRTVRTVPTAQEAIQAADACKPDVVILEMQLVSHSGIEFLYEFRSYEDWLEVPVIVLSLVPPAEFNHSWTGLTGKLGVRDYLYKPQTSLRLLLRAVSAATGHTVHSS